MDTLLLNASYEPLAAIPLERAVTLLVTGRVQLVEADGVLRSPSTTIPRPCVVRLVRYVRVPRDRAIPLNRRTLAARDGGRCAYCDRAGTTIDHVIPRSRGGQHTWSNVVWCCRRCNNVKDSYTLAELGWKLPFTPKAPRGRDLAIVAHTPVRAAWEPYLAFA